MWTATSFLFTASTENVFGHLSSNGLRFLCNIPDIMLRFYNSVSHWTLQNHIVITGQQVTWIGAKVSQFWWAKSMQPVTAGIVFVMSFLQTIVFVHVEVISYLQTIDLYMQKWCHVADNSFTVPQNIDTLATEDQAPPQIQRLLIIS